MKRIEDRSYGYCKITGMKIGLKRLNAMPFTDKSFHALMEIEIGLPEYQVTG